MDLDLAELTLRIEKLERRSTRAQTLICALAIWAVFGRAGTALAQRMLNAHSVSADHISADQIMTSELLVSRKVDLSGSLQMEGNVKISGDIQAQTLYVKSVVIQDKGRTLARFGGFLTDAERSLTFYDSRGKEELALEADDSGSSVYR